MKLHHASALLPLTALTIALAACAPQESTPTESADTNPFNTTLDIKELMNSVIDPSADVLWANAGWIESAAGSEELYPTSNEGWNEVRAMAAMVAETGNLLMLPGRAVDNDAWMIYSQGMTDAGLMAMQAAEAQDKEEFFNAGAQLYSVCSACHQAYNPEIVSRVTNGNP